MVRSRPLNRLAVCRASIPFKAGLLVCGGIQFPRTASIWYVGATRLIFIYYYTLIHTLLFMLLFFLHSIHIYVDKTQDTMTLRFLSMASSPWEEGADWKLKTIENILGHGEGQHFTWTLIKLYLRKDLCVISSDSQRTFVCVRERVCVCVCVRVCGCVLCARSCLSGLLRPIWSLGNKARQFSFYGQRSGFLSVWPLRWTGCPTGFFTGNKRTAWICPQKAL